MAFAARGFRRESFHVGFVRCNGTMRSDLSSCEMRFGVSEDIALQQWSVIGIRMLGLESAYREEIDEAHHKDDDA